MRTTALLLLAPGAAPAVRLPPGKNVAVLLADDLGRAGESSHGTPHLDRLAAERARCTHGHITGEVCSPTPGEHPARIDATGRLGSPHRGEPPSPPNPGRGG